MLFHSAQFALFFVVVFTVYWCLQRWRRPRLLFLLAASYVFYMGWSPKFALLIAGQTLSDYFLARWMARTQSERRRRLLLATSVTVNLGILGLFKYYLFFTSVVHDTAAALGLSFAAPTLQLVLPVGISFYTFQTLSYTLDVFRRKIEPAQSLTDFALTVVLFPQLVAGPIVRAAQILPQLDVEPRFDLTRFQSGLLLFFVGLFKKVLIADTLAETLVDPVFSAPGNYGGAQTLMAVYGYAFQIYGDFSGYSDMAMGLARMLGFELPLNFNLPYRAESLSDFWRRWHITLSTFLRDYLYIPLGGNRGGRWLTCRNLMITMLLGGLWHGAAWTFIAWGALHGFYLVVQHLWQGEQRTRPAAEVDDDAWSWGRVLRVALTFHLVCGGWIFFRAQSFADAGTIFLHLSTWAEAAPGVFLKERGLWLLALAIVLHYVPHGLGQAVDAWLTRQAPVFQGAMAAAALALLGIFGSVNQPFIYFQF
ncbi:MAG TPA: MBOAT family protein [Gemmatales bacterium]|nr:MBOAT family protein [Gemmatales bacterium]HMP59947.1 MBOAT family protein [Gemmatales bacterium]